MAEVVNHTCESVAEKEMIHFGIFLASRKTPGSLFVLLGSTTGVIVFTSPPEGDGNDL